MKIVRLLGTNCHLFFGRYDNGTIAMHATIADEAHPEFGELFAVLTINWEANWEGSTPYAEFFPFPAVVIKNYSELEGVLADLIAGRVVTNGPYLSGSNGGVNAVALTPDWQEIAKSQLPKLP